MSLALMAEVFRLKVGNPVRKLILLKLADHANDEGLCWPSYQHIAKQTEVDRRTVMRHIRALESSSLLEIERRKSGAANRSNLFRLTLSSGITSSPPGDILTPEGGGGESPCGDIAPPRGGGGESPRISQYPESSSESPPAAAADDPWQPAPEIRSAVVMQGVPEQFVNDPVVHLEFFKYWNEIRGVPVDHLDHKFLKHAKRGYVEAQAEAVRIDGVKAQAARPGQIKNHQSTRHRTIEEDINDRSWALNTLSAEAVAAIEGETTV